MGENEAFGQKTKLGILKLAGQRVPVFPRQCVELRHQVLIGVYRKLLINLLFNVFVRFIHGFGGLICRQQSGFERVVAVKVGSPSRNAVVRQITEQMVRHIIKRRHGRCRAGFDFSERFRRADHEILQLRVGQIAESIEIV